MPYLQGSDVFLLCMCKLILYHGPLPSQAFVLNYHFLSTPSLFLLQGFCICCFIFLEFFILSIYLRAVISVISPLGGLFWATHLKEHLVLVPSLPLACFNFSIEFVTIWKYVFAYILSCLSYLYSSSNRFKAHGTGAFSALCITAVSGMQYALSNNYWMNEPELE